MDETSEQEAWRVEFDKLGGEYTWRSRMILAHLVREVSTTSTPFETHSGHERKFDAIHSAHWTLKTRSPLLHLWRFRWPVQPLAATFPSNRYRKS